MSELAEISETLKKMREDMKKNHQRNIQDIQELKDKIDSKFEDIDKELAALKNNSPPKQVSELCKMVEIELEQIDWKDPRDAHFLTERMSMRFSELPTTTLLECIRADYIKKNKNSKPPPLVTDEWNVNAYVTAILGVPRDCQGVGLLSRAFEMEQPILENGNTWSRDYDIEYRKLTRIFKYCFNEMVKLAHEDKAVRKMIGEGEDDEIKERYSIMIDAMTFGHYQIMFGHENFPSFEKFLEGDIPNVQVKPDVLKYMIDDYGDLYNRKINKPSSGVEHGKRGRKRFRGSSDGSNKKQFKDWH